MTQTTACGSGLDLVGSVGQPVRARDLEHENKVLAGALADAEFKVHHLQRRLERLEAVARPLSARLSRSLQPN